MQGLVDYGSSDDSDAGDAAPEPAPAPAPPPADDAYGESESESEDEGPAAKKAPSSGLPSAADLLDGASGSTAWLKKPDWARAQPVEIQPKKAKPPPAPAPTPLEVAEQGDDMYLNYDPHKGWIGKQKTNIDDNHTGYGGAGVRGRDRRAPRSEAPARGQPRQQQPSGKRDKPGKLTGKEKVKQQRLNGQSGIGDHFRVWRSEEEMRMRQQFD